MSNPDNYADSLTSNLSSLSIYWFRLTIVTIVFVLLINHLWLYDLQDRSLLSADDSGSLVNQIMFLALGASVALTLHYIGYGSARYLLSASVVILIAWIAITTLVSTDVLVSLRRLTLFAISTLVSVGTLFIARSRRQFSLALAIAGSIILIASYLAILLVPELSIHSAYDVSREASHEGLWRGVFPHKNEAGAGMVIIAIIGLYVFSRLSRLCGLALLMASVVFLFGSYSKTALIVLPLVFVLTSLTQLFASRVIRYLILLLPVIGFSTISIGSVVLPGVGDVLKSNIADSTFTGRSDVWEFAISNILEHPILGWGFGAFWRTEHTMFGGADPQNWATSASHAHNAYLDAALIGGFPMLLLTIVVFVLMPVRDFLDVSDRNAIDATDLFFIRIWMFGSISACFESVLYNGNNATCCMMLMAIAGLKLSKHFKYA